MHLSYVIIMVFNKKPIFCFIESKPRNSRWDLFCVHLCKILKVWIKEAASVDMLNLLEIANGTGQAFVSLRITGLWYNIPKRKKKGLSWLKCSLLLRSVFESP